MKLFPWFLIPVALLTGASIVKISQLRGSISSSTGLLWVKGDGTVVQVGSGQLSLDPNGNIIVIGGGATPLAPTMIVTHVQAGTPNNFPIPAGKTFCDVSRNIPQSPGEDYAIANNAVVFNNPPSIDDIVRLICF